MDKLPPHDVEAERSLLGSVLMDDEAYWKVRDLDAADFFFDRHRDIWLACGAVADRHDPKFPLNQVTVAYVLGDRLDRDGGAGYLGALVADTPTAQHVEGFRDIITETAAYRRLISYAGTLAQQAYERVPFETIRTQGFAALGAADGRVGEPRSLADIRERLADHLAEWGQPDARARGVMTGFPTLDTVTRGLKPGELIVVGGRPSMGKSAFAVTVARNVALAGQTALIFSLEMDEESLYERLFCQLAGLDATEVAYRGIAPDEERRKSVALDVLDGLPLHIDDTAGLDIPGIRGRLRKFAAEHPDLGLVLVDYLNIVGGSPSDNEAHRLDRFCREIRDMAREFRVPVMLVCQLSRKLEDRKDKRPILSDLRDSGGIEQNADVVLLLYRDDYYEKPLVSTNILEVNVAKQRKGPTRLFRVDYLLRTGAMQELDIYAGRLS